VFVSRAKISLRGDGDDMLVLVPVVGSMESQLLKFRSDVFVMPRVKK
jgi:hypothetical protein